MRKVFLDYLPKKGTMRINWAQSVGCKIPFVYDDIKGELLVKDYINNENIILYFKPNDKYLKISGGHIKECKIGVILGKIKKDFKYMTGQRIVDSKRDIEIIGISSETRGYKCKCNKDGYIWETNKDSIEKLNVGCPVCANQLLLQGVNDMYTTDFWMVGLGVDEDFAKTHTKSSSQKAPCVCPYCKRKSYKEAQAIYRSKSIRCMCGDGFSYPEKFMYAVLLQIGVNFETQYMPKYLSPKRSDFYLPDCSLIIETDGMLGHEGGTTHSKSDKTLKELVEIDKWKDEQHLKHGIKTIRIDCFKSDLEYVKNSILNSDLANLFDLSKVDWNKCEEFAFNNLVKEICDYWNNKQESETTDNIAYMYKISKTTVLKYLKLGNKHGWCEYDPKEEHRKCSSKLNKSNGKKIEVFTTNDEFIGTYENARDLERKSIDDLGVFIGFRGVSMVCNGVKNTYKGYKYKFKDK